MSQVETSGVRNYEISIEVPLQRLRALGLTLTDVASTIRRGSLDLSAGSINTEQSQVRIRTLGQSYDQQDFEDIVILGREDGTVVRLGDIAKVRDGFEDSGLLVRHEGQPPCSSRSRAPTARGCWTWRALFATTLRTSCPPRFPTGWASTSGATTLRSSWSAASFSSRTEPWGCCWSCSRSAFFSSSGWRSGWPSGLGVSAVGALAAMMLFDIPLHEVSLFAFVLAIGIVVDDAIVVSEHIHLERMRGTPGVVAAIRGARRIKVPLIFAVLTTVVAFLPLLFIPAGFGEVWKALPIVVIATLLISLAESLLVLPNHLSHHLRGPDWVPGTRLGRFVNRIQSSVDSLLQRFVQGPLDRGIRFATDWPEVTVAGAIALLVVSVSLLPAGIVRSTFATEVEGDFATATLEMPDGTTARQTYAVAQELEVAGRRAVERLSESRPADAPPLLSGVTVVVGQRSRLETGGLNPSPTLNPEANVATIEFKLLSAQQRRITSGDVVQAWREEVGVLPQARAITFISEIYTLGIPRRDRAVPSGSGPPDGNREIHSRGSRRNRRRLRHPL